MADFLLFDTNAIAYANQHSHALTAQGMEVQAISGTIGSISRRLKEHPGYFPILLWDGRAQWRYDLYPDYKSLRNKKESSIAARASCEKQRPYVQTMAGKLGLTQLVAPKAEADDLGFQLMSLLVSRGHRVRLVTHDTDSLQSLREGFSWLDPRTDRLVQGPADLQEHYGTPDPRLYLEAKALEGDTSDTIPGVPRVGIPTALKVFAKYGGSMAAFYAAVDENRVDLKKKILSSLASEEGRAIFARNMRLMDLSAAPVLSSDDVVATTEPMDPVVFEDWAEHFSFSHILRNVGNYLAPFEAAIDMPGHAEMTSAIADLGAQESHVALN